MKKFIKNILRRGGYEIRKTPPGSVGLSNHRFEGRALQILQFINDRNVRVLLDIGSNVGNYAKTFIELGFSGRIISFEPLSDAYEILEKQCKGNTRWECHHLAVGDEDTLITIRVAGNSESSSILPMLDLHAEAAPTSRYVSEQSVQMKRLDSFLPSLAAGSERVMLKLDVQGYELKVLHGAEALLPKVEIIDVELSLLPLYDGGPALIEMLQYFESKGFVLASIENGFTDPRNHQALQVEAIFVRRHDEPSGRP